MTGLSDAIHASDAPAPTPQPPAPAATPRSPARASLSNLARPRQAEAFHVLVRATTRAVPSPAPGPEDMHRYVRQPNPGSPVRIDRYETNNTPKVTESRIPKLRGPMAYPWCSNPLPLKINDIARVLGDYFALWRRSTHANAPLDAARRDCGAIQRRIAESGGHLAMKLATIPQSSRRAHGAGGR